MPTLEGTKTLDVLVVENDPMLVTRARENVAHYVATMDKKVYSDSVVTVASTPEEGLEKLQAHAPDIAVVNVSAYNGIEGFVMPARIRGYGGSIICWSDKIGHRWPSRVSGADEFVLTVPDDPDMITYKAEQDGITDPKEKAEAEKQIADNAKLTAHYELAHAIQAVLLDRKGR